jgi:hypothetical protein
MDFSCQRKAHLFQVQDQRYALEVSSIQSLKMLIQAVSNKIQIPQPIRLLYIMEVNDPYIMEDNDPIVVTDVKDLREGFLYNNQSRTSQETIHKIQS